MTLENKADINLFVVWNSVAKVLGIYTKCSLCIITESLQLPQVVARVICNHFAI